MLQLLSTLMCMGGGAPPPPKPPPPPPPPPSPPAATAKMVGAKKTPAAKAKAKVTRKSVGKAGFTTTAGPSGLNIG